MLGRRSFLGGVAGALGLNRSHAAHAAEPKVAARTPEPLVWPVVARPASGVRSFDGHTDTVLDIVGRIGAPPSLVIFSEGNHLMALLSEEIVGAFPAWAKAHRDLPEMLARGYVDVGLTQYHLISYWARIFPGHFELVPIAGAERFPVEIALGRVVNPPRPEARAAFEEFFLGRARDVYPRYDFARMTDDEYGAALALD